jgi:hypothetical protein
MSDLSLTGTWTRRVERPDWHVHVCHKPSPVWGHDFIGDEWTCYCGRAWVLIYDGTWLKWAESHGSNND